MEMIYQESEQEAEQILNQNNNNSATNGVNKDDDGDDADDEDDDKENISETHVSCVSFSTYDDNDTTSMVQSSEDDNTNAGT